jgi:hypothetical protein
MVDRIQELQGGESHHIPNTTVEIDCPDCTLVIKKDRENIHDGGCPLAAEGDVRSQKDKEWFEKHPLASEYFRKPTWTEDSIHKAMTGGVPVHRMRVEKVDENHRIRQPYIKL